MSDLHGSQGYCVELKSGAILKGHLHEAFQKLMMYQDQVVAVWWDCGGYSRWCMGNSKCLERHPLMPDEQKEWDACIANGYKPCNVRSYY